MPRKTRREKLKADRRKPLTSRSYPVLTDKNPQEQTADSSLYTFGESPVHKNTKTIHTQPEFGTIKADLFRAIIMAAAALLVEAVLYIYNQ